VLSQGVPTRSTEPIRLRLLTVLSPEIQNVNVGAQSHVVGEIIARIVRIFVEHDVIAVPQPAVTKGNIDGRNAEIEAPEPETTGSAATKPPYVMGAEFTREMTVLPRVIEVVSRIPAVVPNPLIVPRMNVRRIRMSRSISVVGMFGSLLVRLRVSRWSRSMSRNVSATNLWPAAARMFFTMLPSTRPLLRNHKG